MENFKNSLSKEISDFFVYSELSEITELSKLPENLRSELSGLLDSQKNVSKYYSVFLNSIFSHQKCLFLYSRRILKQIIKRFDSSIETPTAHLDMFMAFISESEHFEILKDADGNVGSIALVKSPVMLSLLSLTEEQRDKARDKYSKFLSAQKERKEKKEAKKSAQVDQSAPVHTTYEPSREFKPSKPVNILDFPPVPTVQKNTSSMVVGFVNSKGETFLGTNDKGELWKVSGLTVCKPFPIDAERYNIFKGIAPNGKEMWDDKDGNRITKDPEPAKANDK